MSYNRTILTTIFLFVFGVGVVGCQSDSKTSGVREPPVEAQSITLMTFNVENLFDNADDPGKNDNTYFAVTSKQTDHHRAKCNTIDVEHWRDQCLNWDWNDNVIHKKLSAIAATILQVGNGRGPDILALQEVENIAILERLRTDYLGAANFGPAILIEGRDLRGIDVAFLSRLPLVGEPQLHEFPGDDFDTKRQADTRGILEATFQLPDGNLLTGFAVHFPAPYHPTEMRIAAYHHLNELKKTLPADHASFAAGDFNTTSREDREKNMLERFVQPLWTAVHEAGCDGCRGTQYYAPDDSWSYLDMILWSPAEFSGTDTTWSIRAGSFQIANGAPGQTSSARTPNRFKLPEGTGVSDHWPTVVTIELK